MNKFTEIENALSLSKDELKEIENDFLSNCTKKEKFFYNHGMLWISVPLSLGITSLLFNLIPGIHALLALSCIVLPIIWFSVLFENDLYRDRKLSKQINKKIISKLNNFSKYELEEFLRTQDMNNNRRQFIIEHINSDKIDLELTSLIEPPILTQKTLSVGKPSYK